jgi:hypothetical protein
MPRGICFRSSFCCQYSQSVNNFPSGLIQSPTVSRKIESTHRRHVYDSVAAALKGIDRDTPAVLPMDIGYLRWQWFAESALDEFLLRSR